MVPDSYIASLRLMLPELERRLSARFYPGDSPASHDIAQKTGSAPGIHPDPESATLIAGKNPDPEWPEAALSDLIDRLAGNYPFHHPCYAGQMLKPPHPAAWLAYALAMTINPNNHALDGGPEASRMEKDVVKQLLRLTGLPETGTGHLTGGGTMANLEALWVARERHPDRPIAISSNAHYTHSRMCRLLRHPFVIIPEDENGEPDPGLLDDSDPLPGTIVVTLGSTGTGNVEPLHRITEWAKNNNVRVHVDAAYGGFFHLIRHSGWIDPAPWEALSGVDSIVMDPHKHGLQPYGCGSILFRDAGIHRIYRHESPYTYFTSEDLHLGEISLECSRSGAAAIALWYTMKILPFEPVTEHDSRSNAGQGKATSLYASGTGLGHLLLACRQAALKLHEALTASAMYRPLMKPDLDIVTYLPETEPRSFSAVSSRSAAIMKHGMAPGTEYPLFLSTLQVSSGQAQRLLPDYEADQDQVTLLRSVLMKPEHLDFIPEMMRRLELLYRETAR